MHGFSGNPMYVPGFPGYPMQDPQSDSANRKLKQIRTFVLHMRPLIIIDGAHLKGEFLGTMYLAVAMDGNNQILPLAYGVGKSETFRSWDWFLTKLKECIIGKQDHLTIISDGAVSIASAIKNVFPNAFHGRCCRHLLMNLREKCPRFISKEELFWKACKAYRISDFEERFSTLRDWLPSIANKLDMIGLEKWARVYFPVLNDEVYGKAISVGAVLILRNVSVFSPKSSGHYLNITLKNIVKVFHKDTSAVNSGSGASTSMESYWAVEI
ncbi:putative reverse transcriptase domain-containing protein [Tanacetum coccineum]